MREEFESEERGRSDLDAVLETLSASYTSDARGRLVEVVHGGVLPRFVLGRAVEGCVWRFRADLEDDLVVALARLAGREPGARFIGELPAPPERLAALERVLPIQRDPSERPSATTRWQRRPVTRSGVVVGELWSLD
jgi:hypothetical protein